MSVHSLNIWTCRGNTGGEECTQLVVGVGSAIGLRAIGWQIIDGDEPVMFCPVHRVDAGTCRHDDIPDPCSMCMAEDGAKMIQVNISMQYPLSVDDVLKALERLKVAFPNDFQPKQLST